MKEHSTYTHQEGQRGAGVRWQVTAELQPQAPLNGQTDIRDYGIYATSRGDTRVALGYQNIGGVLNAATDAEAADKNKKYGQRNGDFPMDIRYNGGPEELPVPQSGVYVPEVTEPIEKQFKYLSALRGGESIKLWTPADIRETEGVMIAPYINDSQTEQHIVADLGAETHGFPGEMVDTLKNKGTFREIVDKIDTGTLRVPDYRLTTLDDVRRAAADMLDFEKKLYQDLAMPDYTKGIVIQSVNSDGGFGSVLVKQAKSPDGKDVMHVIKDGTLASVKDGLSTENWMTSFSEAQAYLNTVIDGNKEDGVVVSRFIEHDDSPGGSVVVINGKVVGLGWNGQVIEEGSNACVGTGTYEPKTPLARRIQDEYEGQSILDTQAILEEAARMTGVDLSHVNGNGGIDFMIPSAREYELQMRRHQSPKWKGPEPSAYAVECNARGTNWTDAVKLTMWMHGDGQTVRNMQRRIDEGIQTYDAIPLPEGVTGDAVRDVLLEKYGDYKETEKGLTIVRMVPPTTEGIQPTIGVVMHKEIAVKRTELAQSLQALHGKSEHKL